jgi:hypothetical protein
MIARPLLPFALTTFLACACSAPPRQAQTGAPHASDFEATIARIGQTDPGSPAVLSAQLSYAEFLLDDAPGPCAKRLERAQEQLGSVGANPKVRVMFPDGWARATELEYRLYLARAACGSETNRENELRTAVAAARRAVELYRNAFDYHSMALMQVAVGTALHQLGETAAPAELETALDMDREYGFQDDARENYKLLLSWRGELADDARIAGLMQDFPQRRAVLKFGWHPSDARITLESHREYLVNGQIAASRASATFERRVAADGDGGWSVSHAHRLTQYEPGVWPTTQGLQPPQLVFRPAAAPAADFKVSATGEFKGVTDYTNGFAARLVARTEELIRAAAPPGDRARRLTSAALEAAAVSFSPGMLEAATAESYQLETAMWIGATLDQGVWYEISAPLSLPGTPQTVVEHRIEFAFTRTVPCTAAAATPTCVELVMRATPDKEALDQVTADASLTAYSTSIQARIVTDPTTLLPYAREARVYWYAASSDGGRDSVLQSEHLVSTTSYGD